MAKPAFINDDFLLLSKRARNLYHRFAAPQPIIDYHCHLPPEDIAGDRRWANLARLWLESDHYKWRALRANGVSEALITGDGDDRAKFQAWAETVPKCLRNPLYHWTHLELNQPFGINDRLLDGDTAEHIWRKANAQLGNKGFSARGLLEHYRVRVVCTTDDPADDLAHHVAIAGEQARGKRAFAVQVRPTWRPDRGMLIDQPTAFNVWLDHLGTTAGVKIRSFDDYLEALLLRHDAFHAAGCRLSDHGLETVDAEDFTPREVAATFALARAGKRPSPEACARFRSCMLDHGARLDHARGWVQQFHLGPMRNMNTRLFRSSGPDRGGDTMSDATYAKPLARFLDRLDADDQLAKTIVYNLNPRDNALLATLIGCFQGGIPGKLQLGSAWWFLDQQHGIEEQLDVLSNHGLLAHFVGMLTDSRSFVSYSRHEYFRRVLCNVLGNDMHDGRLPDDLELIGRMVADICYGNAARYFGFGLKA